MVGGPRRDHAAGRRRGARHGGHRGNHRHAVRGGAARGGRVLHVRGERHDLTRDERRCGLGRERHRQSGGGLDGNRRRGRGRDLRDAGDVGVHPRRGRLEGEGLRGRRRSAPGPDERRRRADPGDGEGGRRGAGDASERRRGQVGRCRARLGEGERHREGLPGDHGCRRRGEPGGGHVRGRLHRRRRRRVGRDGRSREGIRPAEGNGEGEVARGRGPGEPGGQGPGGREGLVRVEGHRWSGRGARGDGRRGTVGGRRDRVADGEAAHRRLPRVRHLEREGDHLPGVHGPRRRRQRRLDGRRADDDVARGDRAGGQRGAGVRVRTARPGGDPDGPGRGSGDEGPGERRARPRCQGGDRRGARTRAGLQRGESGGRHRGRPGHDVPRRCAAGVPHRHHHGEVPADGRGAGGGEARREGGRPLDRDLRRMGRVRGGADLRAGGDVDGVDRAREGDRPGPGRQERPAEGLGGAGREPGGDRRDRAARSVHRPGAGRRGVHRHDVRDVGAAGVRHHHRDRHGLAHAHPLRGGRDRRREGGDDGALDGVRARELAGGSVRALDAELLHPGGEAGGDRGRERLVVDPEDVAKREVPEPRLEGVIHRW